MTATTVSATKPLLTDNVNTKYLPKNPAIGGIPARESMAMVMAIAIKGLLLRSPWKLTMLALPLLVSMICTTVNARMEAMA